jgi:hypothetical protein
MVRFSVPLIFLLLIAAALLAGCTSPAPAAVPETATTSVTAELTVTTIATPEPAPVSETAVSATTASSSATQVYYNNIAISMDRKQYELINFEDIGFDYLNNGDKFIVRITSDRPIFVYVIRTTEVPRLKTDAGIPKYDKDSRTYEYGQLAPLMKLEDVYEGGGSFTVKDIGKYTLVLDTRLAEKDYHYTNEVAKVAVRIIKEN